MLERATGCHFTGPIAFARFAGCIRDIAQRILNFFFFFSQYRERKFGESTKKKERGGQKTLNAASPSGLDNPQKIHYTTNRKGAVSCKRLAPYPRIKELTARLGEAMRRFFFCPFLYCNSKKQPRRKARKKRGLPPSGLTIRKKSTILQIEKALCPAND